MSFFGFNIPSFEDEFVQSDSERALENAPVSARRGLSLNVSPLDQDIPDFDISRKDNYFLEGSLDFGLSVSSLSEER